MTNVPHSLCAPTPTLFAAERRELAPGFRFVSFCRFHLDARSVLRYDIERITSTNGAVPYHASPLCGNLCRTHVLLPLFPNTMRRLLDTLAITRCPNILQTPDRFRSTNSLRSAALWIVSMPERNSSAIWQAIFSRNDARNTRV